MHFKKDRRKACHENDYCYSSLLAVCNIEKEDFKGAPFMVIMHRHNAIWICFTVHTLFKHGMDLC